MNAAVGEEVVARLDDAELVALGVGEHDVPLLGQLADVDVPATEGERPRRPSPAGPRATCSSGRSASGSDRPSARSVGWKIDPEPGVVGRRQRRTSPGSSTAVATRGRPPRSRASRAGSWASTHERVELRGHAAAVPRFGTRNVSIPADTGRLIRCGGCAPWPSRSQLVDELVEVADLPHRRLLDGLHLDAADLAVINDRAGFGLGAFDEEVLDVVVVVQARAQLLVAVTLVSHRK